MKAKKNVKKKAATRKRNIIIGSVIFVVFYVALLVNFSHREETSTTSEGTYASKQGVTNSSSSSSVSRRSGKCRVIRECLSATDESSYSELLRVCNRKDETQLVRMMSEGRVYVIQPSGDFTDIEHGFGQVKIRGVIDGETRSVWVASESVIE